MNRERKPIKLLCDGINERLIPQSILKRLSLLQDTNVADKYHIPMFTILSAYGCYMTQQEYSYFTAKVKNGLCNENLDVLSNAEIHELTTQFSNGFKDGYYGYETTLKDSSSLFNASNENVSYKIYSLVATSFEANYIPYRRKNNKNYLTNESMYSGGIKWGHKYKAWEIILNNITEFEPLFIKDEIDLINKSLIKEDKNEQQTTGNGNKRPKKELFDYIFKIEDKEEFIKELSQTFNTEIGQKIKAIIDILKEKSIVLIDEGQYKNFIEVLGKGFERDLGSYNGIQNIKFIHDDVRKPIELKLTPIIKKYKTTTTNI